MSTLRDRLSDLGEWRGRARLHTVPSAGARPESGLLVFPAMFLASWLGFALLPDTHAMLRPAGLIALAALVGVGSELGVRRLAVSKGTFLGTAWIIPAGAVLAGIGWLSTIHERPWFVAL